MNSETNKYFCPRLIDYIIIVGCKDAKKFVNNDTQVITNNSNTGGGGDGISNSNSNIKLLNDIQMPELLRRYPLNDHSDFKLPQDVTYFCQPEGCCNYLIKKHTTTTSNVTTTASTSTITNNNNTNTNIKLDKNQIKNKTTSFIFTLTEKDSARVRYGICINFYRQQYTTTHVIQQTPNSNTSNSNNNNKLNNKLKLLKSKKHSTSSESLNYESQQITTTPDATTKTYIKKFNQVYTLTSLCIITHHPFFSLFRECINILHRIIESCNKQSERHLYESACNLIPKLFKLNNTIPSSPSKFLKTNLTIKNQHKFNILIKNNIWNILTGRAINEHIFHMLTDYICEIETWILRLLSAPVPIPGKTKVIVSQYFSFFFCLFFHLMIVIDV